MPQSCFLIESAGTKCGGFSQVYYVVLISSQMGVGPAGYGGIFQPSDFERTAKTHRKTQQKLKNLKPTEIQEPKTE